MSDSKSRKAPSRMRLILLNNEGDKVLAMAEPGDLSDKALRKMVDAVGGEGSYIAVTGRIRNVTLSSHTVTEFKITGG